MASDPKATGEDGAPCRECGGTGEKAYPTSAGRGGGVGGMTITSDECDHCDGTGIEPMFPNGGSLSSEVSDGQ